MYNVLLVEDEEMVRKAIIQIIDWRKLGFNLVGEASNGEEALEVLEKEKVDLVLTDICMPFMDGLDLSKAIKESYPNVKVVIITGYNEFEYAKKAVEYNVSKYILKPLTADELRDNLQEIKEEMDKITIDDNYIQSLKKEFLNSRGILKEQFFNLLLEEKLGEKEIEEDMKQLEISFSGNEHRVALFKILNPDKVKCIFGEEHIKLINFAVLNVTREILDTNKIPYHCFHHRKEYFAIVLSKDAYMSREYFKGIMEQVLEEISDKLQIFIHAQVGVGVGEVYEQYNELRYSFMEAKKALEYSEFTGDGAVVFIKDIVDRSEKTQEDLTVLIKEVSMSLRFCDQESVVCHLKEFTELLKGSGLNTYEIRTRATSLMVQLLQVFEEIVEEKDYQVLPDTQHFFTKIFQLQTLEEIGAHIYQICDIMMGKMLESRQNTKQRIVNQGCLLLEKNFSDPNYSLQDICNTLYLSTSYFSKIFKSETGKTFKEYLTHLRLERAKDLLLSTSYKTYEIAEKVGYKDAHYFSYLFKKNTGYTTKAFRNQEAD
ncbi:response regulator [Vallitalea okinawensis]|uniref:response regulator n=1 Tax=Vallitalea okinawensis TaxID=2078660 RepID=UPI000CFD0D0A|nr:response regulator [Vallitalea okinawensis]